MRMQGPPRPPVAPPDVKGVPEGPASKARPVGPPPHSKEVSPLRGSKRPSTTEGEPEAGEATAASSSSPSVPSESHRGIIEKTALLVAKGGEGYEDRILREQPETSRFNFLRPGDVNRPYYEQKLAESRARVAQAALARDDNDEMRSRSPRTSVFNKAPAEPDATPVPMAAPAPEPVRYSDTAVPVPFNLTNLTAGQGTPLEQALAGESVAWNWIEWWGDCFWKQFWFNFVIRESTKDAVMWLSCTVHVKDVRSVKNIL